MILTYLNGTVVTDLRPLAPCLFLRSRIHRSVKLTHCLFLTTNHRTCFLFSLSLCLISPVLPFFYPLRFFSTSFFSVLFSLNLTRLVYGGVSKTVCWTFRRLAWAPCQQRPFIPPRSPRPVLDIPIVVLSIGSPLGRYLPQADPLSKPPPPPSPKIFGLTEEKLGPSLTGAILISHRDVHNCPIVSVAIGRPQPFHNLPTSFLSPCCLVR